jgi:hypothetical protein
VRSYLGNIKYMMGFAFWWGNMRKENVTPTKCYYVSYPFREKVTGVRYTTVGWEAIRSGIDDMRYIIYAKSLLEKKKGSSDEADKILRKIFGKPRYSAAALAPGEFRRIRNVLTDIILENK